MIENLLAENESKTIEFKETTQSLGGILKTVVAFANTAGGIIIVGVRDKTKEIVGLLVHSIGPYYLKSEGSDVNNMKPDCMHSKNDCSAIFYSKV